MTKRYYPRGGANYLNRHAKTLLASALILAFNSAQAIVLTPPKNIGDWQGPGEWYTNKNDDEINQFRLKDGQSATFDGVNAEITPPHHQFRIFRFCRNRFISHNYRNNKG